MQMSGIEAHPNGIADLDLELGRAGQFSHEQLTVSHADMRERAVAEPLDHFGTAGERPLRIEHDVFGADT
jgi:hypothetical protein